MRGAYFYQADRSPAKFRPPRRPVPASYRDAPPWGVHARAPHRTALRVVFVADFVLSAAKRLSVRTFAAASDAFFALADRSSAVKRSADFLPPCRPNLRAISVIAARTSAGIFIPSSIHLTRCGVGNGTPERTAQILLTPKGVRCIIESALVSD